MAAEFDRSSSNIQSLSGTGSAKFTEGDRNAIAREITFTETDKVVRLRGDEPTVWDSRARARAGEIDWDTKASRSAFRAGVSTTYYSRKQMKDATPFATGNKPVYVTANSAEFDHEAELAVFIKDARGWQDDNYVRGDRLVIDQANGRLLVEGNIKSQLYNLRSAKRSAIPVSASAASLFYDRDKRLLRYNGSVDIRQGTDRITAGTANVFLTDDNEVAKTIAENNVVISQPGRRAAGTWVQYVASDESVVMRGEPATVSDAKNGSTQSGQITFNMRENRVLSEARTADNVSGRTRSVYRTKPDQ
ncbi:MAG: LptA/OstA family protein [Pyrinomonadaceae bacterium]